MKPRDWAVLVTGTMTFAAAVVAQWIFTQRPIEDVFFLAALAAFIGIGIFAVVEDAKRSQRRKHRAKSVEKYEDWRPVFITLDRKGWGK